MYIYIIHVYIYIYICLKNNECKYNYIKKKKRNQKQILIKYKKTMLMHIAFIQVYSIHTGIKIYEHKYHQVKEHIYIIRVYIYMYNTSMCTMTCSLQAPRGPWWAAKWRHRQAPYCPTCQGSGLESLQGKEWYAYLCYACMHVIACNCM